MPSGYQGQSIRNRIKEREIERAGCITALPVVSTQDQGLLPTPLKAQGDARRVERRWRRTGGGGTRRRRRRKRVGGEWEQLTTLATWAVLGRFEWSRAKIVYSERKAGSAIIPASIWPRQCRNETEGMEERRGETESNEKITPWVQNSAGGDRLASLPRNNPERLAREPKMNRPIASPKI